MSEVVVSPPSELGAEPSLTIDGFPLGDLGLKRAQVRQPDGSVAPFTGFIALGDDRLRNAIARTIGPGATLVNDAGEELILPDITVEEAAQISLSRQDTAP
jgi:hypothetical protein